MPKKHRPFKTLEVSFSYFFQDQNLFKEALTRRSAVEERVPDALKHNERLEMLGDTVLRTQLTRIIFEYPQHFANEEEMTGKIDSMVNRTRQAEIACALNLQNYIICGRSEKQILEGPDSAAKNTILSETLEALLGAIDFSGDKKQKAINSVIKKLWASDLPFLNVSNSVATSLPVTSSVVVPTQPIVPVSVAQTAPVEAQPPIPAIRRALSPASVKCLRTICCPPNAAGLKKYESSVATARNKGIINHPHPEAKKGKTALITMMATDKTTISEKERVVSLLVRNGALWNIRDKKGRTAESIAREKGPDHVAMMQRLQAR